MRGSLLSMCQSYELKALAELRRIDLEGLRWRVFDAKGQVLGWLASQIVVLERCVVLNAKDICVIGRKMTGKIYYSHIRYIGHLKERKLKDHMAKDPTEVIRKVVMCMLPRNKLRDADRKLRIFAEGEHTFHDRPLEPFVMPPRKVREMCPRARCAMIRAQKKDQDMEAKKAEGEAAKNGKATVAA
ncbi:hypothetical protein CFC21_049099 [Triticum aestivum]|uniref:Ribosomal protein L13 n=2 Tax=Triticum aestivum TaxID=4565 RepID=A0A3B6H2N6_WHEAT|nr:hypothetical protein CFC21_049099 [Triticum aestivum]